MLTMLMMTFHPVPFALAAQVEKLLKQTKLFNNEEF
jgi:hypothetical protein